MGEIRTLRDMDDDEVFAYAKRIAAPYDLVMQTKQLGRLPVVLFAAGGVATPADAALMMQLGCDGIFVSSSIFKSVNYVGNTSMCGGGRDGERRLHRRDDETRTD
uniref:pyridoxal 5'-phosphate synthase (glutamine hydrolyzing) n=1 Tax=Oryza rufipogon TaxID=4529 RepID=A0A0E0QX57_ORYRU